MYHQTFLYIHFLVQHKMHSFRDKRSSAAWPGFCQFILLGYLTDLCLCRGKDGKPVEISFEIVAPGNVSMAVYDIDMRLVRHFLSGRRLKSGKHIISWDVFHPYGRSQTAGEYIWTLIRTAQ